MLIVVTESNNVYALDAVSGVADEGADPFIATGNTFGPSVWSGGEAIIRFQPGPVFSGLPADYLAPTN
jgi:hypothetical protein